MRKDYTLTKTDADKDVEGMHVWFVFVQRLLLANLNSLHFILFFREDCTAVEVVFCYKEWGITQADKKSNKFLKSRAHFRLPVCHDLPSRRSPIPKCSPAALFDRKPEEVTSKYILGHHSVLQIFLFWSSRNSWKIEWN